MLERNGSKIDKKELAYHARCSKALRVPVVVLLVCGMGTLNACKTYYKRGGDGSMLTADQAECQRRTGDGAGRQNQACLRELGWVTTGQPLESGAPAVAGVDKQDTKKNAVVPSRSKDASQPEPEKTRPVTGGVEPDRPLQEVTTDRRATAIPRTPKTVGSWFKLGGSQAQLKTDQTDCLTQSQHSKQSLSWSVDPEFLTCMRARGWRALVE